MGGIPSAKWGRGGGGRSLDWNSDGIQRGCYDWKSKVEGRGSGISRGEFLEGKCIP